MQDHFWNLEKNCFKTSAILPWMVLSEWFLLFVRLFDAQTSKCQCPQRPMQSKLRVRAPC